MVGKGIRKHRWTDAQKQWLRNNYAKHGYNKIHLAFNAEFGLNLSLYSVTSQAECMGLTGLEHETDYSLREIASMLTCSHDTLKQRILNGTVKARKELGRYLVSPKEFEKLTQFYQYRTPWPAITCTEAQKRLGYTCANLAKRVQEGSLSGMKTGKILMLKLSEIEAAEAYLRQTGFTRVPWAKLKAEAERKEMAA